MKALLFDCDGVLVDVSESYRRAVQETARRFGAGEIDAAAIRAYKERGGLNNDWDLTLTALRERGIAADRRDVVKAFQEIYLGRDFDGLIRNEVWLCREGLLSGLAGKYALGIVTGRPAPETRFTLEHFGADGFFPVVVTQDDLAEDRGKPDPLGILTALARLGSVEGYYVGDTVDDMRAALGAGLVPIGVAPEDGGPGLLKAGAARIIRDINRIGEVLP